jgi:glycosyltransferase involved in cell wall biosynthesis
VLSTCDGVITICQDLADVAVPKCGDRLHAMIENTADDTVMFGKEAMAQEASQAMDFSGRRVILYTGTFEAYQGLDLLLKAFALVHPKIPDAHLVLVGGRPPQVELYKARAAALGIDGCATFVGQVPPARIPAYVNVADVIVSPRSSGTNTPLKIYGYLRSGRPIVATNLHTHTQTLNADVAELVEPTPEGLAQGLVKVLSDAGYAHALGDAARRLSEARYSEAVYMRKVTDFYHRVVERAAETRSLGVRAGERRKLA